MLGEKTHELSLLKPDSPRIFKSYLVQPFWQEEWESLEQSFFQNVEGPSVLDRLASLHLVGEFVAANVMQFWGRLCCPGAPLAEALQQYNSDASACWKDESNCFKSRCLMSTNTLQFSAMDSSCTSISRALRGHFGEIAAAARSIFKDVESVNISFVGGIQQRFTIPGSWARWCILQRSTCKAQVLLKTIGTREVVSCRRVRKTHLKRS